MIKESEIIAQLNGKFFRMTHDGVRNVVVEVNNPSGDAPKRKPSAGSLVKDAPEWTPPMPVPYQRPWSDEENDTLIDLRGQGINWNHIARYMRRSIRLIRHRYECLCAERGIKPFPNRGKR